MGTEIERKFLVDLSRWKPSSRGEKIAQGYLSTTKERTVRVRVYGENGFITIKGMATGLTRPEYEYPIPVDDALQIINTLCVRPPVIKTRYEETVGDHIWEIDVFEEENAGLVIAEVELDAEDEQFELPAWAGREVTDEFRYTNSNLSVSPFSSWK